MPEGFLKPLEFRRRFGLWFRHTRTVSFLTVPFRDAIDLQQHFGDHGHEFGIITELAYEARADAFLFGPRAATTMECFRPQGGRARYDTVTQEYGTVRRDGTIATYFIPNPAIHGEPSNLAYYHKHCV